MYLNRQSLKAGISRRGYPRPASLLTALKRFCLFRPGLGGSFGSEPGFRRLPLPRVPPKMVLAAILSVFFSGSVAPKGDTPCLPGEDSMFMTYVCDPAGNRYAGVRIGGLNWMVSNLRYKIEDSWCFGNDPANCEKYGRLYTWASGQEACKQLGEQWRLPTDEDWAELREEIGGSEEAYRRLSGHDGFSALLGGFRRPDGTSFGMGNRGYYWSATAWDAEKAWSYYFSISNREMIRATSQKSWAFSCRCVRD